MNGKKSRIFGYKNLEYLNLRGTTPIRDWFITAIVKNFKNLKHLNLIQCYPSSGALKILGQLENLEEILLNHNVDDRVVAEFKNLKILVCQWTSVSDNGVIKVLDNSPNLEHLYLENTKIILQILYPMPQM